MSVVILIVTWDSVSHTMQEVLLCKDDSLLDEGQTRGGGMDRTSLLQKSYRSGRKAIQRYVGKVTLGTRSFATHITRISYN